MTAQHTNKAGREFLFCEVPNQVCEFTLDKSDGTVYFHGEIPINVESRFVRIPKDNYQIICLAKDVSEETAKGIIDEIYTPNDAENLFENYVEDYFCKSATESLQSLIQSLGLNGNVLILEKI